MLAVTPIRRNGMNAISTAMGMVIAGIRALGGCHRKMNTTSTTVRMTSISVDLQVGDRALDQLGPVVDRHDLHARAAARARFPGCAL